MDNKNSITKRSDSIDLVAKQIELTNKILYSDDYQKLLEIFKSYPCFTKLLLSIYYPFDLEQIKKYKSKIVIGTCRKCVTDDYEYGGSVDYKFDYGLIFNKNINWSDPVLLKEIGFEKAELPVTKTIRNFFSDDDENIEDSKDGITNFSDRNTNEVLEYFKLPLTQSFIQEKEIQATEYCFFEEYQSISFETEDEFSNELKEKGITSWSEDEDGNIISPADAPNRNEIYNRKIEDSGIEERKSEAIASITNAYKTKITEQVDVQEIEMIAKSFTPFDLLVNKYLWEKTIAKYISNKQLDEILDKLT